MNDKWILGGYAFYDRRRTDNENVFHQATFGLEALSETMEIRGNFYLPEAGEKSVGGGGGGGTTSASVVGGNFQLTTVTGGGLVERALPGADVEVGYKFDLPDNWEVWAYGGGFHFDADGYKNVSGPRGRLELTYNDLPYLGENSKFTVGVETQTDNVRGGQSWGIARLRIPLQSFGGKKSDARPALSPLDRRMTARIQRDIDIVTGESREKTISTTESATVTVNGQTYGNLVQLSTADDLITEVAAAGANSLVVIDGAGGTFTGNQINMQAGQTLIGGGSVLTAAGGSGATAPVTMPGTRPLINGTQGGFVGAGVNMANDSTVIGVDFIGAGGAAVGLRAANVSGILAEDISVSDTSIGVNFANATGTARNLRVSDIGGTGIFLSANADMTVEDSVVDNIGAIGFYVQNAAGSLNNVTVTNTGSYGLYLSTSSGFTMSNVEVGNTTDHAVLISNATITAPGTGNTITGTVGGSTCATSGTNTGSIAFDDIQGGGPGTCPP